MSKVSVTMILIRVYGGVGVDVSLDLPRLILIHPLDDPVREGLRTIQWTIRHNRTVILVLSGESPSHALRHEGAQGCLAATIIVLSRWECSGLLVHTLLP